jgi:hypothetical protein
MPRTAATIDAAGGITPVTDQTNLIDSHGYPLRVALTANF